jgi:Head domain of trimeric autotransporter adhesin
MKTKSMAVLAAIAVLAAGGVQAQTTLSGDHIVTGNLNVGTSSAKGDLTVTGQTGSSALPGIKVTGDGGVLFLGTFGTGLIPATGAGTRFMWYPKKAALRAGYTDGNGGWDDANIGNYSVAFSNSAAVGASSAAFSYGNAFGNNSSAMSGGTSWGFLSTALNGATSGGDYSTAMSGGVSVGFASVAAGLAVAQGDYSVSVGGDANGSAAAQGTSSTAVGPGATAQAYHSIVIGSGTAPGNATTWVDTDPMLVVGYGTGKATDSASVYQRNAWTVYKNGKIAIGKRQGDIVMGEFGSGNGD